MADVVRDRDIRNAMVALIEGTGEFSLASVVPTEDPQGTDASYRQVFVDPVSTEFSDAYTDGGGPVVLATSTAIITVVVRDEDPQVRDELAERLAYVAANAVSGLPILGETYSERTKPIRLQWMRPESDRRTIRITFTYMYQVGNFGSLNTQE